MFFGTANNLLNAVRELAAGDQVEQLDYVILDFRLVSGVDSSAVSSFVRAGQLAETQGFTVLFTQLKPDWSELLHQGLEAGDGGRCVKFFEDLDSGMEWCEDRILESAEPPGQAKTRSTRTELRMMFPGRLIERAMSFFETQGFQEGEALMRQGRPSDSMYFIDSGGVTVSMDTGDGPPVRLQTLRAGTVVGEIGLYVGGVRTASVIADEPTIAHRLTVGGLDKMSREDPEAGAAFHRYVVRMLAERLAATDRMVRYLL